MKVNWQVEGPHLHLSLQSARETAVSRISLSLWQKQGRLVHDYKPTKGSVALMNLGEWEAVARFQELEMQRWNLLGNDQRLALSAGEPRTFSVILPQLQRGGPPEGVLGKCGFDRAGEGPPEDLGPAWTEEAFLRLEIEESGKRKAFTQALVI